MKVEVKDASGLVLDWLACTALGWIPLVYGDDPQLAAKLPDGSVETPFNPSKCWAHTGLILEKTRITVIAAERFDSDRGHVPEYAASVGPESWTTSINHEQIDPAYVIDRADLVIGPTMQAAAVRCFVINELGKKVEVPDWVIAAADKVVRY